MSRNITMVCKKDCLFMGRAYLKGQTYIGAPTKLPRAEHWHTEDLILPKEFTKETLPKKDKVILCGRGPSLDNGIESGLIDGKDIAIVNHLGFEKDLNPNYWFSLHGDRMEAWLKKATEMQRNLDHVKMITGQAWLSSFQMYYCKDEKRGGGSALFALESLFKVGYQDITIIGVDLTDSYRVMRKGFSSLSGLFTGVRISTNSSELKGVMGDRVELIIK